MIGLLLGDLFLNQKRKRRCTHRGREGKQLLLGLCDVREGEPEVGGGREPKQPRAATGTTAAASTTAINAINGTGAGTATAAATGTGTGNAGQPIARGVLPDPDEVHSVSVLRREPPRVLHARQRPPIDGRFELKR